MELKSKRQRSTIIIRTCPEYFNAIYGILMRSKTVVVLRRLWVMLALVMLSGCAMLDPDFDEPTVTVTAFRALAPTGTNPEFAIDLHIVNPNSRALELRGLAYSASIEGHKVLTGVGRNLPVVQAYGEADVSLNARADMLSSFRLLADLMQHQRSDLHYTLEIKLDLGSLWPPLYLTEKGKVGFGSGDR